MNAPGVPGAFFHSCKGDMRYMKRNRPDKDGTHRGAFEKNKKNPEIIPQSKNIKSNQWQDSADKVYSMIVENEDWYAEKRDDKVIKI